MGFFKDIQTTAKNAGNRISQADKVQRIKSEISKYQNDAEDTYVEIGKLYYENVKDPNAEFAAKSKELVDRIDADFAKVDELNKQIEETIEEHQAIREANKKEADDQRAAEKAEREAAKAAKAAEEGKSE